MSYRNLNLVSVRRHCISYPQSLGLSKTSGVRILDAKFILDPEYCEEEYSHWMRALRTAAWLNQDGRCICGKKLQEAELHHALVSKKDVQGAHEAKRLIDHSFNVVLVHPACHSGLTRQECFSFLSTMFGYKVIDWYKEFPIKSKLNLQWR